MDNKEIALVEVDTADGWWDGLPSVEEPSNGSEPSRRSPRRMPGVSRRRFIQSALAIGGAVSLNGLQMLSGFKLRPAGAVVGSEYTHCAGFDNGQWPGYNGSSPYVCVGAAYSYIYCGSDGWFKNGYFDGGNTLYRPIQACGWAGWSQRNAWRWSTPPYRYRCADGRFSYYSNGRWTTPVFKICSQWIGYA